MSKYINRTIEKDFNKMIDTYPVIMVTGPRQVGKTTLLNYIRYDLGKKINFVTLDNLSFRTQANEDPELFLRNFDTPLIIDEFQYAPDLLSYIKMKVDESRMDEMFNNGEKLETLYYLTGSQIFKTMEDVSESLAGRVGIIDLYALSTRELYGMKEDVFVPDIKILKGRVPVRKMSMSSLYKRIWMGSYPELYKEANDEIEKYYELYVRTYIERDVRKVINIKDEIKFYKFVSCVAARTAQEYNALDIANDIGVDSKTIDEWMSILKNTGLVFLLQPYMNNNLGRIIKRPKIYFMDTGLACYLTGYTNADILEKSIYNGAIFETYVVSEIIKSYTNNRKDPRKYLYYYRDNNKNEIDLLIMDNNKIYPVEIKKNSSPSKNAFKNFHVLDKLNMEIGDGVVLCMCSDIYAVDDNNYYVPIEYI